MPEAVWVNPSDGGETPETDALWDECLDAKHTHAECETLLWKHSRAMERRARRAEAQLDALRAALPTRSDDSTVSAPGADNQPSEGEDAS